MKSGKEKCSADSETSASKPSGEEVLYCKEINDLEDFSVLGSPCLVSRELGFMMTS